ncbi:MAG: chemotaxis protein CheA, partial [Thermodesulfobacteriota bacterium]
MDDIFDNEEMQEILHDFIVESSELLESVDQQLIELEQDPGNQDILNSVFRSVHTIKGASGFLGFKQIIEVAHKGEEVLNKLRQGDLKITPTRMDALLACADMLSTLINHIKEKTGEDEDISDILQMLSFALEDDGEGEGTAAEVAEVAAAAPVRGASEPEEVTPEEVTSEEVTPEVEEAPVEETLEEVTPEVEALIEPPVKETLSAVDGEEDEAPKEPSSDFPEPIIEIDDIDVDMPDEPLVPDLSEPKAEAPPAPKEIKEEPAKEEPKVEAKPPEPKVEAKPPEPKVVKVPEPKVAVRPPAPEPKKAPKPKKPPAPEPKVEAKKEAKGITKDDGETIRVDTERLDSVMNMVGELVLGRNRLARLAGRLADKYEDDEIVMQLQQNSAHVSLITADLQLAVMKTRMQQIAKVFGRFPRMVRDLAKEKNKDVKLELIGQDTELDKTVIEEIGDPLVHLVRNSVDHGIELPDVRAKNGKPRAGTLTLSAYHKGNHIYVSIKDDGAGINVEVLKEKAIAKSLLSKEEAERMTEKEALNLIFKPGFSTATVVTNTSGRGVGMDVVKTNIGKLNGSIDIESTVGEGTNMILRLPLTLAIIHALMVSVGAEEEYAVPLTSVVEILKIEGTEINTVGDNETLYFRDRVYPLLRLREITGSSGARERDIYAVLMAHGDKVFGLLVEELIGQEEVVIKSMGSYLANIAGVSGATITGD